MRRSASTTLYPSPDMNERTANGLVRSRERTPDPTKRHFGHGEGQFGASGWGSYKEVRFYGQIHE